jgi:hypothetical protein
VKKARAWFQRAVAADADLGDAWAYYHAFEKEVDATGDKVGCNHVHACRYC